MATEKILNTRVILKHDSLENWNKDSAIILKEGEVALAKVDTNKKDPISGELVKVPTYLIKVGDGISKFSTLNWVAAPAADVYDWAKKPEAEFTTWVKGLVSVDDIDLSSYYTKDESDKTFVAIETGKSLIEDTKITKLDGISEGATKVEASETNGNIKIDGVETTVYTLPTIDTGVMDVQSGSCIKVDGDDTKTVSLVISSHPGNVELSDDGEGLTANADITVSGSTPQTVNDEIAVVTGTMSADGLVISPDFTNVATPKAIENVRGEIEDALEEAKQYADDNDANTEYHVEYDSTNKKIKLVAGADASKMEIDATAFIKDGMIESVVLSEDGLNLVITWNTDSGKGENNVTTIPLSGLVDVYDGVDGTTIKVDVSNKNEISAEVKTNSITDGHIATNAAIAKSKLASGVQDSLDLADTALQKDDIITGATPGTISVDGKEVAVKEVKTKQSIVAVPSDAAGKFVTSIAQNENGEVTVTYGGISAENIDNLEVPSYELAEKYTAGDSTTGHNGALTWALKKDSDYVGQVDVVAYEGVEIKTTSPAGNGIDPDDIGQNYAIKLKDGGVTTDKIADDAVTADKLADAINTKIDGAIQTISTPADTDGEPNGLKAVKTGTDVAISIDDSVTFVFDCGTSEV